MEINKFLEDVKNQFDESDSTDISLTTNIKELDTWDSLTATAIQVMIDDDYGVKVSDHDMQVIKTVEDLFNLVLEKRQNG